MAGGNGDNLVIGQRIALGLPSGVDVQDPQRFPDVPELVGTFLYQEAGSASQFAGRLITSADKEKISFIAPLPETMQEVLLVGQIETLAWTELSFATSAAGAGGVLPAQCGRTAKRMNAAAR